MLSYQHAYHAGNFADVHKHLTLYAVTDYLLRKESAVTYVDTHAGRGLYPLSQGKRANACKSTARVFGHFGSSLSPAPRSWAHGKRC